jgi:predicted phage gp36 major capsid-like protein
MSFLSSTAVPIDDAQGSSNNATRVYLGYWPHLLIGIRTELMITILRERYADFGQFALLAWLRADVNAEHDQSFCDVAGILPSI